ncbi:MAG TPA: cytochrome c oxidase subunit II [Verrucomicrobiae bacterium]|nr:cytochrome c oxidase subunit II [Verrucomicrobiae bacterium]
MHVHRYERLWIWLGSATMIVFFVVLAGMSVAEGINPPSHIQTIDPSKVGSTPPFDHPGLRRLPDGSYEAYYVGRIFSWSPAQLTIPRGATVTFYATSTDVVHGFAINGTDVNIEVVPGWVSSMSHTFDHPGDYLIICNQYCGAGHSSMSAHIVVQ